MFDWLFDPVKDSKPYWMELLPSIIAIILAISGYWWGFKVWKKQKKEESRIAAGQQRVAALIAACKAVWALLAYMSEKENSKTVFVARGDKEHKTWHLRLPQADDYLNKVEDVFFAQGHGIFMPKDIRDDVYEFRSRVYRLLDSNRSKGDATSDMIAVNNKEVIDKVVELRTRLNARLREVMDSAGRPTT